MTQTLDSRSRSRTRIIFPDFRGHSCYSWVFDAETINLLILLPDDWQDYCIGGVRYTGSGQIVPVKREYVGQVIDVIRYPSRRAITINPKHAQNIIFKDNVYIP